MRRCALRLLIFIVVGLVTASAFLPSAQASCLIFHAGLPVSTAGIRGVSAFYAACIPGSLRCSCPLQTLDDKFARFGVDIAALAPVGGTSLIGWECVHTLANSSQGIGCHLQGASTWSCTGRLVGDSRKLLGCIAGCGFSRSISEDTGE